MFYLRTDSGNISENQLVGMVILYSYPGVLVSPAAVTELPQTWHLKTTERCSFTILEAKSLKSRYLGESLFCLFHILVVAGISRSVSYHSSFRVHLHIPFSLS